jgi:hypothetical protein
MIKIKIGDIFEINTPKGKAYLHYIYNDKTLGELVRILRGLYPVRPENLDEIAQNERYMLFFPLKAACNRKIVEKVSYFSAANYNMPKYMRDELNIRGKLLGWHIIDTATWKRQLVKDLTKEQLKLSPWGIWNDTLLIERLSDDWSLEKWS